MVGSLPYRYELLKTSCRDPIGLHTRAVRDRKGRRRHYYASTGIFQ